jgi:hypothetical protein
MAICTSCAIASINSPDAGLRKFLAMHDDLGDTIALAQCGADRFENDVPLLLGIVKQPYHLVRDP